MNPTPEQEDAIDLFLAELGLAIEAGAGTGKTTTLQLMGRATQRRGQYVAFNTSIVNEAQRKMPRNVAAATMHSLAMRSTGRTLRHRLDSGRMRSSQIALLLDTRHFTVKYGAQTKVLQPSYLGSLTMRAIARFCQSADPEPLPIHVPYVHGIDVPTNDGPGWENNDRLREVLAPALTAAWRDLVDPGGKLPFRHDHYLKLWQLSEPRISADFILFDEAQDASPVMLAIVAAQTDSQLVFVGDSQQQIYAWRGAVNALQAVPGDARTFLTHSFRFGPEIAEVANIILARLNADLRLVGRGGDSVVAHVVDPKCILTRTNAASVNALLVEQRRGRRPHLIGGGDEVLSFTRAAKELKAGVPVMHPDLACFESWPEVLDYVAQDPQGDELRLLVDLIEEFGVDAIVRALDPVKMPLEPDADVVVSTVHKAKGREWDSVRLASDFADPNERDDNAAEEWRLLYVAATRARSALDVDDCGPVRDLLARPTQPQPQEV